MKSFTVFFVIALLSFEGSAYYEDKPEGGIYQYQSSFHGPYGGTHIPFWEVGGSAIVMDNYVRLTPTEQSKKGYIWTTRALKAQEWEIQLKIAVGSSGRLGADGMALWIVKERAVVGSVYGGPDRWDGLGVMFDTFDNDGKRDNPVIYAVHNDGSFPFEAATDGKAHALGSCIAQIRQTVLNPDEKWVKVHVRYQDGQLSISYDLSEINGGGAHMVNCFTASLNMPNENGFYIGLTGETGGLSDFHDVKQLTTWALDLRRYQPPTQVPPLPPQEQAIHQDFQGFEAQQPPQQQPPQQQQQQPPQRMFQQPPPPQQQQQWSGGDPAPEVLNKIQLLEQKEQQSMNALNAKLKVIEDKFGNFERDQTQSFNQLQRTLESLQQRIDQSGTNDIKTDLQTITTLISSIQSKVYALSSQVEVTSRKSSELQTFQITQSEQLSSLIQSSGSWGFWTFFVIFQILFSVAFLWWKKSQDDKKKFF